MCLAAGAFATTADVRYRGQVNGAHGSPVAFNLHYQHGRAKNVHFDAEDVALSCNDGSQMEITFTDLNVGVGPGREFDKDGFTVTNVSNSYVRIHGELRPHGHARGFIFVHLNGVGSDQTTPAPGRACTTLGGKQPWHAERRPA